MNESDIAKFYEGAVRKTAEGKGQLRVLSSAPPEKRVSMNLVAATALALGMIPGMAQAAKNDNVLERTRDRSSTVYQASNDWERAARGVERFDKNKKDGVIPAIGAGAKLLRDVLGSRTMKSVGQTVGEISTPDPQPQYPPNYRPPVDFEGPR